MKLNYLQKLKDVNYNLKGKEIENANKRGCRVMEEVQVINVHTLLNKRCIAIKLYLLIKRAITFLFDISIKRNTTILTKKN